MSANTGEQRPPKAVPFCGIEDMLLHEPGFSDFWRMVLHIGIVAINHSWLILSKYGPTSP